MNSDLWSKQIDAIVRLELRRHWLGRRWLGTYLLVLAPIALLFMRLVVVYAGKLTNIIRAIRASYKTK